MDIATTLLEYGAQADAESKAGFTPLHLSSQEGHSDMSSLLIEHQANANHAAKVLSNKKQNKYILMIFPIERLNASPFVCPRRPSTCCAIIIKGWCRYQCSNSSWLYALTCGLPPRSCSYGSTTYRTRS